MKFLNQIDGADKVKQDSENRFVTDMEKAKWNEKQDELGYTPVNKAGDTMTGNLKVNAPMIAAQEIIIGYDGTTESLQRHKLKYNPSTGFLELWRFNNSSNWVLSVTFPHRTTGEGGVSVEGKNLATEEFILERVLTPVPANAKFTDTTYTEITATEIDAGTGSSSRVISGRRIGHLKDTIITVGKVQPSSGWWYEEIE